MLDEIDALIERRARERGKANALEALRKESERAHRERERRENRALWFEFFCRQADSHRGLAESYAARAEALCRDESR